MYVSDVARGHDFDLLKKLVLPDGTILRCQHHTLPTHDYIFTDPSHDGITMLKLWNLNKGYFFFNHGEGITCGDHLAITF